MNARTWRRGLLAIIILSAGAIVAYRWKAANAPQPILGVVHQTEIHIAPETSGRLVSFRVAPGQEVRKGDILAELSSPELTAAVQEARPPRPRREPSGPMSMQALARKGSTLPRSTSASPMQISPLPRNSTFGCPLSPRKALQADSNSTRPPRRSARPKQVSAWLRPPTRRTRRVQPRRNASPKPRSSLRMRRSRLSKPSSPRPHSRRPSTASSACWLLNRAKRSLRVSPSWRWRLDTTAGSPSRYGKIVWTA